MSYFDMKEIDVIDRSELIRFVCDVIAMQEMISGKGMNPKIGQYIDAVLGSPGGMGGDPLWAIEHHRAPTGLGTFEIWRGNDIDQTEENAEFPGEQFIDQLRSSIISCRSRYPDYKYIFDELFDIIARHMANMLAN